MTLLQLIAPLYRTCRELAGLRVYEPRDFSLAIEIARSSRGKHSEDSLSGRVTCLDALQRRLMDDAA